MTPTIEEIRKAFPGRVPEDVTAITYAEQKPQADGLYKENSFIEWIGYWKGYAVGIKKFLFGSAGWAQIVLSSVALFTLFMSEPVQKPLAEFSQYAQSKIAYVADLPSRYVTFGELPPRSPEERNLPENTPIPFSPTVLTVAVSGSWSGLG